MSNLVPDGWTLTSIGEITNSESLFKDGDWVESKDQDPSGDNRLIQLADVGDGRFINKSSRFMNDEQFTRLKCTELKKGDVLVARMPEPLGRACIYPLNNTKAATIVDIAIIRTNNADHYWLMSAINSSDFRYHIDLNASGTTRTRIARGALSKLKLIAPPLPEQQKIAKILTSVDEVIEKTQAQIDKLKDLKTGMMQELLTNGIGHTEFKDSPVGRIPAEWDIVPLSKLSLKISDGIHSTPKYSDSLGYYFINGNNLKNGQVIFGKNTKFVSCDEYNKQKKDLGKNTILMSINGTIGNLAYYEGEEVVLGKSASFISLKEEQSRSFIFYVLQSERIKAFYDLELTGSTIRNLSLRAIKETPVALPSESEQIEITKILSSVDSNLKLKNERLRALQNTKKALMQDLLTGKVRVSTELNNTEVAVD